MLLLPVNRLGVGLAYELLDHDLASGIHNPSIDSIGTNGKVSEVNKIYSWLIYYAGSYEILS